MIKVPVSTTCSICGTGRLWVPRNYISTHFDWKVVIIIFIGKYVPAWKKKLGFPRFSLQRQTEKNDEYIVQPVICIKVPRNYISTHFDWKVVIIIFIGKYVPAWKKKLGFPRFSLQRQTEKNDEYIVQPVICIKVGDKSCFSTIELFR